jgi:hypothetical protein
MNRFYLPVALIFLVLVAVCAQTARAGLPTTDEMKVALKTATPEEDGFIDRVQLLVKKNKLPEDLVMSTFIWAKRKIRYKFQYFKRGLIVRADQRGISL